ncbi:MAG: archease [Armatimonadota bacterium]
MWYSNNMQSEHRFETFSHTADIGIVGIGKSKSEAFENAVFGIFSQVADLEKYQPDGYTTIEVDGVDDIDLLERFISKLIVVFEVDKQLPISFEILELKDDMLICKIEYKNFAEDIEWLGPAPKAVTFHRMLIEKINDIWKAQVIVDV